MMQLDHMARGRAMFGVGPGALIYDADKIGLKAADQRRRMTELLDCIMELMQGGTVTRKTDWFTLNEARLQLMPYSQPGHGDGGCLLALAGRGRGVGQARHRHAVDRRHVRRGAAGATPRTGRSTRRRRPRPARSRTARSGASSPSPMSRRPARRRGPTWRTGWPTSAATSPMSRRSPSSRPTSSDPVEYPDQQRPCLHRHAGRLHPALRAAVAGLERRLRRRPAAVAQLGGLGSDQAQLRADGALRPSAFPAPIEHAPGGELRQCQGQARDGGRRVGAGRAERDRAYKQAKAKAKRWAARGVVTPP